ncbi:phosphoribosylformylglycinamidine synthase [Clostridium kluyveri]|uniref:Phosphoribosylformylglycinamidine synthase n=1 Tax=Clostridium kluyveri TaxID=1534 RepID=A0A1L5F6P1_CLOKL|nr:phosphoribosylformylglycinamidine synthase [Clostridium kluyveri]APM38664.1 phosphoribosylformylglycinamidine synthase [Clostridium kluyveri]UZQ50979.1 phosphoribosylformylglycinamidine synthase [Clostridium kluyveri]
MSVKRLFVEKKKGFDIEAQGLLKDIRESLGIYHLEDIKVVNRYDIENIDDREYEKSKYIIFSEKTVDNIYEEEIDMEENTKVFAVEYLPGQYDQRADSASQCIQILTQSEKTQIASSKVYILYGDISEEEFVKIKNYCINPVDSREASLEKLDSLESELVIPESVEILDGFIEKDKEKLEEFIETKGLAMSIEDLIFCQRYFKEKEGRDPTITEIKVIDTYWSDHCRHTTFMTELTDVSIEDGKFSTPIKNTYEDYLKLRNRIYTENKKPECLMDIGTIAVKKLRKDGKLKDLDESDEINACSIVVDADINGKNEKWLVMFKNETHNHPTEIEPFGGAATCLGGAIRDPLSGRSYVYQAMRVTGSGDPRTKVENTLKGKLPQKKITLGAAEGYSSYGNQIGLATGMVSEIYDEGYVAKRMEIGAVIAAVPFENVKREKPVTSDVIILLGGRTGRDGCGGATGSSKKHTESSILTSGAEVQKGNPVTERKIQRLFRKPEVSKLIKRCNDFGAGGVSVAIGELTEGLEINLDLVPKKYEGLDGTELAISESQERMAVVVSRENQDRFIEYARQENLEATKVADVTGDNRLKMFWRGDAIVDLSREFLDTNGVRASVEVKVKSPEDKSYFQKNISDKKYENNNIRELWIKTLKDLNVCSQKGLVERFDSSIGASTVLMPFGGKYQDTPTEAMAAKLPVLNGDTNTATIMSYGYNPDIAKWSPFHGAVYAVVESAAKIAASGGDVNNIKLTFQEYFEKLGKEPERWGKPFSALLGALYAQEQFGIAAIGGKDSMSGSFKDMDVPPTLVSFAVSTARADKIISPEFKGYENYVVVIPALRDEFSLPDIKKLKENYGIINSMIKEGQVLSAHTVKSGGICEAVSKMSFGNRIGMKFKDDISFKELFSPEYGSIILEIDSKIDVDEKLKNTGFKLIGFTQKDQFIEVNGEKISILDMVGSWEESLENIFPTYVPEENKKIEVEYFKRNNKISPAVKIAVPKVIIPVFPGTNCEYDTEKAFKKAGAQVETVIIKNLAGTQIEESVDAVVKGINSSQIIMLPGGFSAGDEPEGSGKFIATFFRNSKIKEAVMEFLNKRDGLMLGICNGFQALIKLGLVPFGKIRDIDESCPTLTYNKIGRHVSTIVNTKVISNLSPWFNNAEVGDIHSIAVSHGEGRFVAAEDVIDKLKIKGQIATQYVDLNGNASCDVRFNPNGSYFAVEGITSPDGRILGKMGHSERIGENVFKNIPGEKDQKLFEAGVNYFKI